MKVAEQIQTEDPEAYEYLTGTKGMERIGAGFIALLASIMFALFDLTASLAGPARVSSSSDGPSSPRRSSARSACCAQRAPASGGWRTRSWLRCSTS